MILEGTVHVLGDSVDTDVMIAGRYLSLVDHQEIAKHMFEEVDPGFVGRVKSGDILVAGRNFGNGSGREHAVFGLKALGISCIVATSFARTFYRMCIDLGLPILVCPEAFAAAKEGESGRVDTGTGEIRIGDRSFAAEPLPDFVQEIVELGGLTEWVKRELRRRQAA